MGRIIVEVMPKPEILDPQGKAVGSAPPRLGIANSTLVRQDKCFHLGVRDLAIEKLLVQARTITGGVLPSPIIGDVACVEAFPEKEAE